MAAVDAIGALRCGGNRRRLYRPLDGLLPQAHGAEAGCGGAGSRNLRLWRVWAQRRLADRRAGQSGCPFAQLDGERREQARRRLFGIVDEVAEILARERIDCDFAHGGVLYAAARYPEQEAMGRNWLRELRRAGHGEADFRWLDHKEAQEQLGARDVRGGVFSPHCAVIQPARLAQGLARAAARLGGADS
ncbi:FAD-binding oxidoreductase [Chromobacterium haemolyticum]|nr:FAD-binding oxidoreductase [Chromobacterium haemolyticum]